MCIVLTYSDTEKKENLLWCLEKVNSVKILEIFYLCLVQDTSFDIVYNRKYLHTKYCSNSYQSKKRSKDRVKDNY